MNGLFILSFKDNTAQASYKRYYLPPVEIKEYKIIQLKNNLRIYDYIRKIATSQGEQNWLFPGLSLFQTLLQNDNIRFN